MATITNTQKNPVKLGDGKIVMLPLRGYDRKFGDKKDKDSVNVHITGLNELTDTPPNFPPHATHAWVQLPEDAKIASV